MKKQITIGLDVDDVLIEFNKHILSLVNEKFDTYYKIDNLIWDFNNLQPEHRAEAHRLFSCRKFFKTLELPTYSKLLIKQLQDLGLNVVLITNVHPNVADLRYKMFEDLDVDYIYTKRKDLVKVDLLVEDSPTNALKTQSPVVLLKQPWNKHLEEEGFEFIDHITELLDYVTTIFLRFYTNAHNEIICVEAGKSYSEYVKVAADECRKEFLDTISLLHAEIELKNVNYLEEAIRSIESYYKHYKVLTSYVKGESDEIDYVITILEDHGYDLLSE